MNITIAKTVTMSKDELAAMPWEMLPQDAGQIVEMEYAQVGRYTYRWIHDRADWSSSYARSYVKPGSYRWQIVGRQWTDIVAK